LSVDVQDRDPHSALNFARRAIAERKLHPALVLGDLVALASSEQVLAFERRHGGERIVCAFNLSRTPATLPLSSSAPAGHPRVSTLESGTAEADGAQIRLGPLSAFVAKI
jgi:alpha-glucosidase